jgi:hypothetical protein
MKRAVLLAIAAVATCAPAAWGGEKANTTVTIDSAFFASGETQWAGDIMSPLKACKNERRVLLFRVTSGPDEKVGSTKSFRGLTDRKNYFWTFSERGAAKRGKYYAKVKPTDTCQGDRSENIQLQ